MALPAGITTATVTFGKALGVLGTEATITATVALDRPVIWSETGDSIYTYPDPVESGAGGFVSFPFPHVDQGGFIDQAGNAVTNFAGVLIATVRFNARSSQVITKPFQVFVGQTNVDLDMVPGGSIVPGVTAPSAAVLSVAGETGIVDAPTLASVLGVTDLASELSVKADLDEDGVVVEEQLPERLTPSGLSATIAQIRDVDTVGDDWNNANRTGRWIDRGTALNSPTGEGWWVGEVTAQPDGDSWDFIRQEVRLVNSTDYTGSMRFAYRRYWFPPAPGGDGWRPWERIIDTESDLTASFARVRRLSPTGDAATDTAALGAALAASKADGLPVFLAPGRFRLNAGLTWDPTSHSIVGDDTILDFTAMTSGTALSAVSSTDNARAFRQVNYEFTGIKMEGPTADATTVDGIRIGSVAGADRNPMVTLTGFRVTGFRDALIISSRTWLPLIERFSISAFKRRGVFYAGASEAGENLALRAGAIHDGHNVAGTATAIYWATTAAMPHLTLSGVSLDYNDLEWDVDGGTLNLIGCHVEDETAGVFGKVRQTSGVEMMLNVVSTVFFLRSGAPDKTHLIENVSGNSRINFAAGCRFNNYARTFDVVKITAGSPIVQSFESFLTKSKDDSSAQSILSASRNRLFNPGFEAGPNPDGWAQEGSVGTTTVQTTTVRSGTRALQFVGTGVAGTKNIQQTLAVRPGDSIVARAAIKAEAITGGNVSLILRAVAPDGATFVATDSYTISADTDWRTVGRFYSPPSGTGFVLFRLSFASLNGTAYVDDCHFETV